MSSRESEESKNQELPLYFEGPASVSEVIASGAVMGAIIGIDVAHGLILTSGLEISEIEGKAQELRNQGALVDANTEASATRHDQVSIMLSHEPKIITPINGIEAVTLVVVGVFGVIKSMRLMAARRREQESKQAQTQRDNGEDNPDTN
jgi:hypothetical protein